MGSDEPAVGEVVTGGLVRNAFEGIVHHVHWGGLEVGVDCDQEGCKHRREKTGLDTYTTGQKNCTLTKG